VADLAEVFPPGAMVVGSSWGAMLALSFAARHPSLPRALALVGTGTYDPESRTMYATELTRRLGRGGRAQMRELGERLRSSRSRTERDELFASIGRLAAQAQAVDPIAVTEPDLPVDGRGYEATWSDALRLQRKGIEPQAFAAIHVPVLMLHGAEDPHPGPRIRDRLRQVIPQLEYVELAACGHEPWRERLARDAFLSLLREWLTAHAG
jgi:pimeloyl-ACP methyl ester carboxylesterase